MFRRAGAVICYSPLRVLKVGRIILQDLWYNAVERSGLRVKAEGVAIEFQHLAPRKAENLVFTEALNHQMIKLSPSPAQSPKIAIIIMCQ